MTEIRRFNSYGSVPPKTYGKAAFTPEVPGQTAAQIAQAAGRPDQKALDIIDRRREIASRGLGQFQ